MDYFVITNDGYGLPIAERLQNEGANVTVGQVPEQPMTLLESEGEGAYETEESRRRRLFLYEGILLKRPAEEVIDEVKKRKAKDDFVFFDLNHHFRYAERLGDAATGNPPKESDLQLEIERDLANEFVREHYPKLKVAPYETFEHVKDAKRFLRGAQGRWVLKGRAEDSSTVVPSSPVAELAEGEVVAALKERREEYETAGFLLEKLIQDPIEITPQRIYFDGKLVATFVCIENKPFGAGNIGPMTDCAGDMIFRIPDDAPINEIAFPPIVDKLARGHRGMFTWDGSILFDPKDGTPYFGEFCANRVGYNSFYTELTLCGGPKRYFEMVRRGENPYPQDRVATSVTLFNSLRDPCGLPKEGIPVHCTDDARKTLWLQDVASGPSGLQTAGFAHSIGVATGTARSVEEAADIAYAQLDYIAVESSVHRPKFDYLSREYPTSILNRLHKALEWNLFTVGFEVPA
ncbi:hypothetical protein EON82_15590 [bacterium]|nr:MAG: hypothetical protein EON82_15590 [bacterium]